MVEEVEVEVEAVTATEWKKTLPKTMMTMRRRTASDSVEAAIEQQQQ